MARSAEIQVDAERASDRVAHDRPRSLGDHAWPRAILVGLIYFAFGRYSVVLHDMAGLGSVFWPGAGVTVTALLVSPRRFWPAILAAVGAAELANNLLLLGGGPWPSLWWATANMAEPLIAALLIQHWRADGFRDVRSTLRFVAAAVVAAATGGLIGALGTSLVSELAYPVIAGQWLIGDGLGILTVVPFGLLLVGRISGAELRSAEAVFALTAVALTAVLVFGASETFLLVVSDYLILLPMVWAAVRFRIAGGATALFIAAQLGSLFHALGRGPFTALGFTDVQSSAHLQVFLAVVGVTVLVLASRTVESETFHDLALSRERLIAAVSHELRTPLTPILGYSETLLTHAGELDEMTRRGLEAIQRNGRHLDTLIEDLLQASRTQRGALPVQPELIEIGPFVDTLLRDRPGTTVEAMIQDGEARCWADPAHLTQILTNLLANARRHGQPPIQIEATSDGSVTRLAVVDHGDGVPDWFLPHLFEEFAQADTQRSGLGLGLPIARSLARANRGELTYVPSDRGACFVLTLPAAPPAG